MNNSIQSPLAYDIIRSRRTTVDIVIERDGRILVRAPESFGDDRIVEIVESKRAWIHKHLMEWQHLNATRVPREYRNGESFLYLGRTYRLLLIKDQEEPLQLKNGRFCLRRDLVQSDSVESARGAFREYYASRGLDRISKRVAYYAPKVGVTPSSLDVRDTGNRWGSCSAKGKLAFHWKCMMAPQTVIDYLVVHELCHFYHRDHTDAFWNEVDKVIPEYRERKEWLRKYGASLDI